MPWKDTSIESERLQFIERHTAGEETVAELCRRSGISRKTGYKIIGRYEAYGEDGLLDLSRAPHSHPNATPVEVAERIIEAKRTHPTWGPKKIVAWLHYFEPYLPWPSSSTAGTILDRAGLVRRRKRRRRATRWGEPFAHARHPNDVWAIDLKGWFRTDDGMRIDPLTAPGRHVPLLTGMRRSGPPCRPGRQALSGEGLPRVRHPSGHTHRQWSALRQCGSGQPLPTLGMVGQARDRTRTHRARTPRTEWTHRASSPNPQGRDRNASKGHLETATASPRTLQIHLQLREAT